MDAALSSTDLARASASQRTHQLSVRLIAVTLRAEMAAKQGDDAVARASIDEGFALWKESQAHGVKVGVRSGVAFATGRSGRAAGSSAPPRRRLARAGPLVERRAVHRRVRRGPSEPAAAALLFAWALVDLLQIPLVSAVFLSFRLSRRLGRAWKAVALVLRRLRRVDDCHRPDRPLLAERARGAPLRDAARPAARHAAGADVAPRVRGRPRALLGGARGGRVEARGRGASAGASRRLVLRPGSEHSNAWRRERAEASPSRPRQFAAPSHRLGAGVDSASD